MRARYAAGLANGRRFDMGLRRSSSGLVAVLQRVFALSSRVLERAMKGGRMCVGQCGRGLTGQIAS
jgi:hypothetical protein